MKNPITDNIKQLLAAKLVEIETHFDTDAIAFHGGIENGLEDSFLQAIEDIAMDANKKNKLLVILTTGGGSAEVVERCVNILRYHYAEVNFLIPSHAYSAGTIFCMSGDNIYMDYFSVLGPIDPQIQTKEGRWIPALGYLDKVNEMLQRDIDGQLSNAEFQMLQNLDLAELRAHEQARDFSIDLLKKWLVQYKFKDWGTDVATKKARAEEIAAKLSDNNLWQVHSRPINIKTLNDELKLKIEDYSTDLPKRNLIRSYHNLVDDYVKSYEIWAFLQTRKTF